MKIILASNNKGKLREFEHELQSLKLTLIPQQELDVKEIAETGLTFVENALLKARHAAKITGLPTLADDSGLVVPYLQGMPGIFSARFAGEKASSEANINKLLKELSDVPAEQRNAFFYCVLVVVLNPDDPVPLISEGRWQGMITTNPIGTQGFGYDPIFYIKELQKTAAELPLALKNQLSHRGQALKGLQMKLPEKLCLPSQ